MTSQVKKDIPLACTIWKKDFDLNFVVDNSLLFPEALTPLERSNMNKTISMILWSHLRDVTLIRFYRTPLSRVSKEIAQVKSLSRKAKNLEASLPTIQAEKLSLEESLSMFKQRNYCWQRV